MEIGAHVVFDWSGSLRLARQLWALAERLEALASSRGRQAHGALVDWTGQKAVEFASAIDQETGDCARLAAALRAEATGWAIEWTMALTAENWVRYQEACRRVRDDRGLGETIAGFFVGHDDLPPEPRDVRQPHSPDFVATRMLVDYSNY